MSKLQSLTADKFRKTFLVFYALCALIPLLILIYVVFQYVLPALTPARAETAKQAIMYGLSSALLMQVLGFFLMAWWTRRLEQIAEDIRTRAMDYLPVQDDFENQNEMMAIQKAFDGMYQELQEKIEELNDYSRRLVASSRKLSELALTDDLTTLYNRRHFEDRLTEETARAERYEYPLSLMMIDVNDFKLINDTYGHPVGDKVLNGLGLLIRQSIRKSDVPFRYGGDEFSVLLPQCTLEDAARIAQKIVQAFASMVTRTLPKHADFSASLSCGVALYKGDAQVLLQMADQALYTAKSEGKGGGVAAAPTEVAQAH